jgi:hypothetical protein
LNPGLDGDAMLEENLKRLAEDLELPPFPPKDRNSCILLFLTKDLSISIKSLRLGVAFFANVAPIPLQKKEEAFMYFMKANLLGQGTGDQVLGIDLEEKSLTLSCVIPYDMDYKEFKEKIEDFANYLDYWCLEAKKLQEAAQESML